jgi:hypothetical protein
LEGRWYLQSRVKVMSAAGLNPQYFQHRTTYRMRNN